MGQKEALLYGTKHLEPVDLSDCDGPPEVLVRPLADHEAGQYRRRKFAFLEGVSVDASGQQPISVNALDIDTCTRQARYYAVARGLTHSGEEWTEAETREMPVKQLRRLEQVICRISGIEEEEGELFRAGTAASGDGGDDGAGAAGTVPAGDSPGP